MKDNTQSDGRAALEFVPGNFYVAVWLFDLPLKLSKWGKGGNVLGTLWRPNSAADDWHYCYRFRHYRDERIHDHRDALHSYEVVFRCSETDAVENVNEMMRVISAVGGGIVIEQIDVQGDSKAVLDKLLSVHPEIFHQGPAEAR